MEETRSKRTAESNREKFKKNGQEKKTKSDTIALSSLSSVADISESFMVVGKGCNIVRSRQNDIRLHECFSETAINQHTDLSKSVKEVSQGERPQAAPSNSSFTSAKSDFSDAYQKQIHDLEEGLKQNLDFASTKKQLGDRELVKCKSVSTETDVAFIGSEEHKIKLKELEKKISSKDRRIKDLSRRLEECHKAKEAQIQENRGLNHKVGLLHRQLQSMFEFLGKKSWNAPEKIESSKNKAKTELETLIASHNKEKKHLSETVERLTFKLEAKEKEISVKSRELVQYKNKSTLEMCKLINQIDCLQKEAKNQSDILEAKISEAQTSMEDEIVNITLKLEEQYQKDVESAIERFHADFARLADLPRGAIEQLLKMCEPGSVDIISYQKDWEKQQSELEAKIESLQQDHNKNIQQVKDTYEGKIMFLKAQVEALSSQLKERKEIIDIFESELRVYKSNSSMNLLKASTLGDDISALKELYTAEIFSQKQISKLHVNIFEEKVKTMKEEIIYLAKNEEICLLELENAKKMAFAFREKYEQLVLEWEEKAEKDIRVCSWEAEVTPEFDNMVGEFMGLIQLLKKTEEAHEEKIKILEARNEQEKVILLQDIEDFRIKLENLMEFQKIQENLDGNIHDLIKAVGRDYTDAVETLLRSHVTELSYKQMEMYASEKRHIEEIEELKNHHEQEVESLRHRVEFLENARAVIEKELTELSRSETANGHGELEILRKESEEMATKFLRAEGIIAAKEEVEKAFIHRIQELENTLKLKEENCRKELENITAECLKEKVISSAKDDLAKELEDKLNSYETLLEKSCKDVDKLTEICSSFVGNVKMEGFHLDEGDFGAPSEIREKFGKMKEITELLKTKLVDSFGDLEVLNERRLTNEEGDKIKECLKEATEKNALLEKEINQIANENNEMRKEISSLMEILHKKEKILAEMEPQLEKLPGLKQKIKMLETAKDTAKKEKEKILQKNFLLEATVKDLNERIDHLKADRDEKEWEEGEMFSVSLQEIRFLYEEEQEVESTTTVLSVACQTVAEWEGEGMGFSEWESETITSCREEMLIHFKNIQEELSEVTKERDGLLQVLEKVGKERNYLREQLENVRQENCWIWARYDAFMLTLPEREAESGMTEVNKEIGKLSSYVKVLSEKLDMMKATNDLLLNESQEHLKHNQNLVSELEEAWSQRYEIEDQLAKVRKENAMLNLHRKHLEETNKRISTMVTEGKPSVLTWIKIHETVENIVEEVLALKTSVAEPDSVPGCSDSPGPNNDLKAVAGTMHAQLKNKALLCDDLIVQKESFKKELESFGTLLETGYSKLISEHSNEPEDLFDVRAGDLEFSNTQSATCFLEEQQTLDYNIQSPVDAEIRKCSRVMPPSTFKMRLEEEVELEEAQFQENLDQELKMQKPEKVPVEKNVPLDEGGECLKTIELQYEQEVAELSREFEREVEKLKEAFGSEKEDDYAKEIDKLKNYFQNKWEDLEKRYTDMYNAQKGANSGSNPELNRTLEQFLVVLREEDSEDSKMLRMKNFLREILNRRDEKVESLRQKYQEAVDMLTSKHDSEVRQLQAVVLQLKENIMTALSREGGQQNENLIEGIRAEYEAKLEEEKKRLCNLLEEAKQRHEKEVADLEEFWTEKLSECETRCALVKATGGRSKSQREGEAESDHSDTNKSKMEQSLSERSICPARENQAAIHRDIQNLGVDEAKPQSSLCVSCITNQSFLESMELKTDDDKLDVIQQREALEEMIFSMRNIVSKLLTFIGHQNLNLDSTFFCNDETMYKTIQLDPDRSVLDATSPSNGNITAFELSTIFQEIKDNSLLNSSEQVRFELDRCLKQLTKDATSLLALSCPENNVRNLSEMIKRVEREKNELEAKVFRVEEVQNEMKKEITSTRERLSQWERNLEVVSEGYGEEIMEPRQTISLSDLKEKLKTFLTENCGHTPQDLNLMEEICKEGDRLQEEWLKEKCDLQQQIDVADKQLHSLKKFLEEQALEREQEREAFDREINQLQENLKAKERDNSLQNRTNREVEALASQVKDLTARLTETEKNKSAVEEEFQNAVKKIWSLREVIQDLEVQLAEVSEKENNLKKKVEKMDGLIEEHTKANRNFKEELEACRNQNELKYTEYVKSLEEELMRLRHVADQVNPESLNQLKTNIREIEALLIKKTKDLEQLHVSSANVSCSSPSEDISIRDHLDATRCSTPDEMSSNCQPLSAIVPMEEIDRIHEKLARHTRAEEVAIKYVQDLKMQLRNHRKALEEVQTERDVLLDKVDVYLKENSSLKVRLEEQRCNAGLLQKQLNANLESQISRLEVDVEKLNEMCHEKDKQLREMKTVLENATKTLKIKETEAVNKGREINTLITTLKTDLANALSEKEKLEEKLESTVERLKDTMKMPALVESIIDEKNAEIDRLEKEVARLSTERSTSSLRSFGSEERQKKRKIRFSEPDSFSENISPISVQYPSDLRNCSDSFADFRSSFRGRRPVGCSTKLESNSSIAPLQLSPRGGDSFSWKASSPIVVSEPISTTSPKTSPAKPDLEQMEEISKLHGTIESKQREIAELHLEIDILKRQLVEVNQEVATAISHTKEIQNDLSAREEEIQQLKNKEMGLLASMESLKTKHAEEVEELENKLRFERGKVEKVYEEIKTLEDKKIEIEEAFLNLKEDYSEKINGEKRATEALLQRIEMLEARNEESELKSTALEKELEKAIGESEKTIQTLTEEMEDLRKENEKNRLVSSQKENAETQVEEEVCVCQNGRILEMPQTDGCPVPFRDDLDELKAEFEKLATVLGERDFNKREAFSYAMAVRRLFSVLLGRLDELTKEVEEHMKRVRECSVDDLAVKVQRELVLSAKLDNQLLSSIRANGLVSKEATPQPDSLPFEDPSVGDTGGGDGQFIIPKSADNSLALRAASFHEDVMPQLKAMGQARDTLQGIILEQKKMIKILEEDLKKEKGRIFEEKERCIEDAKIMELLRVNLEKALRDLKARERELKKEKQKRIAAEKEMENCLKQGAKEWDGKKIQELNAQLESQKDKLVSMSQTLEEEKRKTQEAKLALEECQIERLSDKTEQKLMENDLALIREQKENYKMELLNARKLLHSRNMEIGLLKRKINLLEIDVKALTLSGNIYTANPSETSSRASNAGGLPDFGFSTIDLPTSLLYQKKKLNSNVHTEVGDPLLYLGQEDTEHVRDYIRVLEENGETKLSDETLICEGEVEKKLWALEKERMVMDLETLHRENDALRRDLVITCKNEDALREENSKLAKELKTTKAGCKADMKMTPQRFPLENNFLEDRITHLTYKCMRTESHRKALAWQKNYLLKYLQECQRFEDPWRKPVKQSRKLSRRKVTARFKVVAIAIIAIFRMRYIMKRWRPSGFGHLFPHLESQTVEPKVTTPASVLNIYNEPVNPLSYQTQNIFHPSSSASQVLRTPPSRDPGPLALTSECRCSP